jgi:hypothetical protein
VRALFRRRLEYSTPNDESLTTIFGRFRADGGDTILCYAGPMTKNTVHISIRRTARPTLRSIIIRIDPIALKQCTFYYQCFYPLPQMVLQNTVLEKQTLFSRAVL